MVLKPQATYFDFIQKKKKKSSKESAYKVSEVVLSPFFVTWRRGQKKVKQIKIKKVFSMQLNCSYEVHYCLPLNYFPRSFFQN